MPDQYKPYFGAQALLTNESSHDTFDASKFRNWLVNCAGIGAYAHGRIHQQVGQTIFVGDLIHKRGYLKTDDLLLMEEQMLLSCGEPLSVPSRLGKLVALEMLPTMNTANGEGDLIAYYEHGVVAFNTFEAPRETRYDGEGQMITKGWDQKRLVNHLLNTVGAVGRYSVAVLPRDHLFRSSVGLHFLKTIIGQGTFNSENINTVSTDVEPLLLGDTDLSGAAVGFWTYGHRMFATVGLVNDPLISSSSSGRGFVSWNQANTYTEDRTPRPVWEGMWTVDHGVAGIHNFVSQDRREFAFLCSGRDRTIYKAVIDKERCYDERDGECLPIEWSFETGQFAPSGLDKNSMITDCLIELVVSASSQRIRVSSRTDRDTQWKVWKDFQPAERDVTGDEKLLITEALGQPHREHRECTWIQLLVEGVGTAEIRRIDLDFSLGKVKAGRSGTFVVGTSEKDPFEINSTPADTRWPQV